MSSAAKIALLIIGALLLALALIGSGLSIREISIPRMSRGVRFAVAGTGVVLIATGIVLTSIRTSGGSEAGRSESNSQDPKVSQSPRAQTPNPSKSRAEDLLGHVPSDIRSTCKSSSDIPKGALAVVVCDRGVEALPELVNYVSFPSLKSLDSYYDSFLGADPSIVWTRGNCSSANVFETGKGQWDTYSFDNSQRGRFACYVYKNQASFAWTEESTRIMGLAMEQHGSDLKGFLEWALKDSGPLPEVSSPAATAAAPGR